MDTIIDSKIGRINVFYNGEEKSIIDSNIEPIQLISGEVLVANTKTSLNDFFSEEVLFLGKIGNQLQFVIGEERDLFNETLYCQSLSLVGDDMFINIYQIGTARDYRWKKKKGVYGWF